MASGDKVRLFDDSESMVPNAVTCFEKVCVEGADRTAVLETLWARFILAQAIFVQTHIARACWENSFVHLVEVLTLPFVALFVRKDNGDA